MTSTRPAREVFLPPITHRGGLPFGLASHTPCGGRAPASLLQEAGTGTCRVLRVVREDGREAPNDHCMQRPEENHLTRRKVLLEWLDDYVVNLRILSQRHLGADRIEDQTDLLFLDWRMVNWYDSLWLFELEGIRASRYPGVLDTGNRSAPR